MPYVIKDKRALVMRLRNSDVVTAAIPRYQWIEAQGNRYLAVPHTDDTWHVLNNLGVAVAGYEPIRSYYVYPKLFGKHLPMPHQNETAVFCVANKRCYVLNEMRTGKSASVLWASDYLVKAKQVKKVLILCTTTCMDVVWRKQLFGVLPHKSVAVLAGTHARRLQLLQDDYDYYVLNHDGVKIGFNDKKIGLHGTLMQMVKDGTIGLIIMDEGSEFRNATTAKWKALRAIARLCPRVWWLTGTPSPGGPEDVWAQCKIVTPNNVPELFTTWRNKVMYPATQFKWAPKAGHEQLAFAAMQPAVRFCKNDVLDMMPVTYEDRQAELTQQQSVAYLHIKKQGVLEHSQGTITAVNAAVLLGKLLQIAAGVVKDVEGDHVAYAPTHRLAALDEIIEQANAKVIVFAPYRAVVDLLVAHIGKRWTVAGVDGRVTGNKRADIIREFQDGSQLHVLVAHPKTTGHGLELSAADTIIWYAPMHSVDIYEQANNRIMSGLQKRSMGVYHIGCTPLEWKIYKALKEGVSMQQNVLKLYNEEILGST